jgi:hypothetical protein
MHVELYHIQEYGTIQRAYLLSDTLIQIDTSTFVKQNKRIKTNINTIEFHSLPSTSSSLHLLSVSENTLLVSNPNVYLCTFPEVGSTSLSGVLGRLQQSANISNDLTAMSSPLSRTINETNILQQVVIGSNTLENCLNQCEQLEQNILKTLLPSILTDTPDPSTFYNVIIKHMESHHKGKKRTQPNKLSSTFIRLVSERCIEMLEYHEKSQINENKNIPSNSNDVTYWHSLGCLIRTNSLSARACPRLIPLLIRHCYFTLLCDCLLHIHDISEYQLIQVLIYALQIEYETLNIQMDSNSTLETIINNTHTINGKHAILM